MKKKDIQILEEAITKNFTTVYNKIKRVGEASLLKENSDTYFETLSATLDYVRQLANQYGYELDEDDVHFQFGTGGISYGQAKSANIQLLKNGEPIVGKSGKPLNRAIRVSIYRMDSGRYELTAYKTW